MKTPILLSLLPLVLLHALALSGCPNLPDSTVSDADTTDGEVFVSLELDRAFKSVGEPAGGERVAIYGAGFTPGAEVLFGDQKGDAVLVLDEGQINVTVPGREPGLVDITVRLPDGQTDTLDAAYLYRGPIRIESIAPSASSIDGGLEVEVQGAGFTNDTRILVGGRMLEGARRLDDTTIRGKVPSRLLADAGLVDVIATNGFEQRTLVRAFSYTIPLALTGLDPVSGPSTGGTFVTLKGRGLSLDNVVRFGGIPAENVSDPSVGSIGEALIVRAPPGAHGAVDVTIAPGPNTDIAAALPGAFFQVDPTRLPGALWAGHAVPESGSRAGGTMVAISVRSLTSGDGVKVHFGTVEARVAEVRLDSGTVIAEAPASDVGEATLVVSRNGVQANALSFEYLEPLELTRVQPEFGPTTGGDLVLVGRGLDRRAIVKVGGKLASYRSGGGNALTIKISGASPGSVDVVLVQDGREHLLAAAYDYRSDSPKMWAISPELGAQSGGRIVRVYGEGFMTTGPEARFGGMAGEDLTLVDDHVAIVRAPRGDPGQVNVRGGELGFLAKPYEYYDPSQRFGGATGATIPEALNVTVLDAATREGVPDAFVMLWDDLDGPYQGLTDDRGQLTFSDVYFGPMQMVTASKDDYTTSSIVEFDARDVTLVLIPLSPSNPGGGGGGPGPAPLPDGTLRGSVTGFDKYIVTPPGDCDARISVGNGTLCAPCASDEECGGNGNLCTLLGDQGARCTKACTSDFDCPANFVCGGVDSGVQCVPDPGRRTAQCQVTMPDVFSVTRGALVGMDVRGDYELTVRPGEYAVVCLGGMEDSVTKVFKPVVMGVRRHVFAMPGTIVNDQNVPLDIPLSRDLRLRLDGAPVGRRETEKHRAQVFVNFGADGVFLMPQEGSGIDLNVFDLSGFPVAFEDSLYDASLTVYGEAVENVPDEEQTGIGSFVVHDQIRELFADALFEVTADGASQRRTGIKEGLLAMAGSPGGERLWAVGEEGRVVAWDGTFWALQQTPTKATLRGVWAAPSAVEVAIPEVWAVGDYGAVMRWDGLRWLPIPMPAEVAKAIWWGVEGFVEGDGYGIWLWGERGVYRRGVDGTTAAVVSGMTPGSVLDVEVIGDTTWLVGRGGLIRRWVNGAFEVFDKPGADLRKVVASSGQLVWAVGDGGRILRWDGTVWFELLPVTARVLHGLFVTASDRAWAVGDAGEVLRWDGTRWRADADGTLVTRPTGLIEHADLRAVAETRSGRVFTAGLATLIVGPFMQMARPSNPNALGNLGSLTLSWLMDPGADASFNFVRLLHSSGFPFWRIMADGPRTTIPLPDLEAAWGLQALWPGSGFFQIYRVYVPGFDMGSWDESIHTPYRWRSWSVTNAPLNVPEPQ